MTRSRAREVECRGIQSLALGGGRGQRNQNVDPRWLCVSDYLALPAARDHQLVGSDALVLERVSDLALIFHGLVQCDDDPSCPSLVGEASHRLAGGREDGVESIAAFFELNPEFQ